MSSPVRDATILPPEICAVNPASVIASTQMARTLTISDQHATILLTSSDTKKDTNTKDDSPPSRSLLKIVLVPFHKTELACLPTLTEDGETETKKKTEMLNAEKEHSEKVLAFLSQFHWRMTSESGAEYSYHEAFLKPKHSTYGEGSEPEAKRIKMDEPAGNGNNRRWSYFKAELISPASDRQIDRVMPLSGLSMITETTELYNQVTKPLIESIKESGSLSWIENVVAGKKEKERLLHDAQDWILNVDTKWRTHPDALAVPRSQWYHHESTIDLYCLGIAKPKIASLRDLTEENIPMLKDMLVNGPKVIESVYGVKADQLRIFVHYQPQFYHFHVHFIRLENEGGTQVERAHLLADIIQNLELDSGYYRKRTMTYKLSLKDKLYKLIKQEAAEQKL